MRSFFNLLDNNDFFFWGTVLAVFLAVLVLNKIAKKKNFATEADYRSYYSRHDNDGTAETAAYCFIAAFVCVIIATIYNILSSLFKF